MEEKKLEHSLYIYGTSRAGFLPRTNDNPLGILKNKLSPPFPCYDIDHAVGIIRNCGHEHGWRMSVAYFHPYNNRDMQIKIDKAQIEQILLEPHPYDLRYTTDFALEMLPFQRYGNTKGFADLLQKIAHNEANARLKPVSPKKVVAHVPETLKVEKKAGLDNLKLDFDYLASTEFRNPSLLWKFILSISEGENKWNGTFFFPKGRWGIYANKKSIDIDYPTYVMLKKCVDVAKEYHTDWLTIMDGLLEIGSLLFTRHYVNDNGTYHLLIITSKSKAFMRMVGTKKNLDKVQILDIKNERDYRLFLKTELNLTLQ